MAAANPILVTGSHRSGSTWTGKMIALSSKSMYIQEPFNEHYYNPGICRAYFDTMFCYVTDENGDDYYSGLRRTASFQYNWRDGFKHAKKWRDYARIGMDGGQFMYHRLTHHRPIFKDPFALLSTEWLVETFEMAPIVLIRHPAAFVSSVKRFNWESPNHIFLEQDMLMRDLLEPLRDEIEKFVAQDYTIVEKAAQFWKVLHYVINIYQQRHPEWYFARHEDLSRYPVAGFQKIYDYLNLPFTSRVQSRIAAFTNEKNPSSSNERTTAVKLNSRANIWSWKERLTPHEIERIREISGDVGAAFYADDEW